jgi:hypothetical protein
MLRRTFLLTLAGVAAAVTLTSGQTGKIDGFTATVANVDALNPRFSVDLLRWSTDAQRDQITAAFAKDETALRDALRGMESVGYLWTGEPVGYPIRYAFRQTMADGAERIVLLTDRRLGAFLAKPWAAQAPAQTQPYEFALVEIRLPKGGPGEGKLSLMATVTTDAEAKTLALDNYAAAPVALRNVRRNAGT